MVGYLHNQEAMILERPVRLAVFIDQALATGGGFQQALNVALLLNSMPKSVAPVFITTHKENVDLLAEYGIRAVELRISLARTIVLVLRSRIVSKIPLTFVRKIFGRNYLDRFLDSHDIDLVCFTSPTDVALLTEQHNFVFTVWDLCHRDEPEFPEVREGRAFERRERLLVAALPKATAVIVDSDLGRSNIVRRYGVDPDRAYVLPFSPAVATRNSQDSPGAVIDIKARYSIDGEYVYYPAQFWAHKNHVYVLRGLRELEKRYGIRLHAIFSGADKGNMKHVRECASSLGLETRVRFVGFVQSDEVPSLYEQAMALVMPTYFGPTNLPPLEAFTLGVPVLYSDLPGMREQVGDAALLLDLRDPGSLAEHLYALTTRPELRKTLVERGKALITRATDESKSDVLEEIVVDYGAKMSCWKK